MPFQLLPLVESDCAAFAALDAVVMEHWPVAKAMGLEAERKGQTRQEMVEEWMRAVFEKPQVNGTWLKVVDMESGDMIAAASWGWQLDPDQQDNVPVSAEVEAVKTEHQGLPPAAEVFAALRQHWTAFRGEFFPSQPFYNLQICITHPAWERRGAGSMMVKYGCDKADAAGVITVLGATDAGYPLYLKHGFQVVQESDFDLKPFGVDAIVHRRSMIRQPQSTQP